MIGRLRRRGPIVVAAAFAAAAALLALELTHGGPGYGRIRLHDPCAPRPGGAFVLRGLDAAACRRGESREQLLLDAAGSPLGGIATSLPDLRAAIEHWLERSLQGLGPESGASAFEREVFRALNQLFAAATG